MSRTTWVEAQAARFCEFPLVAETVFHSLRYLKGGLEKEVCDILLRLRGDGIIVSLKADASELAAGAGASYLQPANQPEARRGPAGAPR